MDRIFYVGQRIIWDSRDVGTVVKLVDQHSCVVRWDNPKLGCTYAPMWSSKFQSLINRLGPPPFQDDESTVPDWCEDTLPEVFYARTE